MNVDTDIAITMPSEEAVLLRSALHIATRLAALLPAGYGNRKFSDQFGKLHDELRDAGVEILPDTVQFSENILDCMRNAEHPDDRLLRDLFKQTTFPHRYGLRGAELQDWLTVGYGGRSVMSELDFAAIEARVLACLLDPTPPIVLDASQLPFEFKGTVTGRTVLPGSAMPDNVPRKLPDVLMDDQSARHVALTASQTGLVNKAEPKGWIVQYNLRHGSIALANWAQVRELGLPQPSRNAAYRMLKARAEAQGIAEDAYRVVPAGTPDGPEKDRGFYTAEFFTKHAIRQHQLGWHTSSVRGLNGTFPTAQAARNAIDQHVKYSGATASRYRVKWHKNVA